MNLKQELAQARKETENNNPVIMKLREKLLNGARKGKSYVTFGNEQMSELDRMTVRKYLDREKMTYDIKYDRRKVIEEIHYDPTAPDFRDQLRWHGYRTEHEVEKDIFQYYIVEI